MLAPLAETTLLALAAASALLLVVGVMAGQNLIGSEVLIESFQFLGCQGEWPMEERLYEVRRTPVGGTVAYVVTNQDTCGSDGAKDAHAYLVGDVLDLCYVPYYTSGSYVACSCKYAARFTFKESIAPRSAKFNGRKVRLAGSWAGR